MSYLSWFQSIEPYEWGLIFCGFNFVITFCLLFLVFRLLNRYSSLARARDREASMEDLLLYILRDHTINGHTLEVYSPKLYHMILAQMRKNGSWRYES